MLNFPPFFNPSTCNPSICNLMFVLNAAREEISSRLCQFQIEVLKIILFLREQVSVILEQTLDRLKGIKII